MGVNENQAVINITSLEHFREIVGYIYFISTVVLIKKIDIY